MIRLSARASRGAIPRASAVLLARRPLAMAAGVGGVNVRRPYGT